MLDLDRDNDTICARATPPGTGGIAVIRVSGPRAWKIVAKVGRQNESEIKSHHAYLRSLTSDGVVLDEALITYFAKGKSFTGDQSAELSCHGSPAIVAQILRVLCESGCRMATPGEFTYRAFINGKMDLVQAENVLKLIESKTDEASRLALRNLKGELSRSFLKLEDRLVWVLAQIEADIDFSTEGLATANRDQILAEILTLIKTVDEMISGYRAGRLVSEGVRVGLFGPPNAGKSSLMNALVGHDRAIVSSIPGTTRDLVESAISYHGMELRFLDTAGLRESIDEIEKIGIEKARGATAEVDLRVWVLDGTANLDASMILQWAKPGDILFLNKTDLPVEKEAVLLIKKIAAEKQLGFLLGSAKSHRGIDDLLYAIGKQVEGWTSQVGVSTSQARHYEIFLKMREALLRARELIEDQAGSEFVAFELQESVRWVHELVGKVYDEQVIDRVFKEFCLGK